MSSYKTRARDKGNINNDYVKATRAGTSVVNGSSLSASNLQAGLPVKTDNSLVLQSTKLDIADTNGLQSALDSAVQYQGTLPAPIGALVKISDATGNVENSNITEADVNNKVSKSGDTMTGTLDMSSNNIDNVGILNVNELSSGNPTLQVNTFLDMKNNALFNLRTITGNGVDSVQILNGGQGFDVFTDRTRIQSVNNIELSAGVNNISCESNVNLNSNDIIGVSSTTSGVINCLTINSTDVKQNEINFNSNIDMKENNIVNINRIDVDEIGTGLTEIKITDTLDLQNNNLQNVNDVKLNSLSANVADININNRLLLNNNDVLDIDLLEINNLGKNGAGDITLQNDVDVNNFDLKFVSNIDAVNLQVSSINNLTSVGGLYSGISDGNVINQASGQSDLLPISSVGSLNIPANGFQVGDAYHLVVAGTFPTEQKGDTINIEIKQNGTSLGSLTLELKNADVIPSSFEVEADFIIRRIGVTGSLASNIDFTFNEDVDSKFEGTRSTTITTIDTTTASTLSVLATVTGTSSIQSTLAYLRKQY